ncbi:MAG TPA: sigma-54 dependent transcriptional regulator, partial [Planctomycetota bacterium]|nr:sigma-54 dependent transcriptional regulator [Planctomycetota bacterium]
LLDRGGRALLETLHEKSPEMSAILLDGHESPKVARDPISPRIWEIVPKPINLDLLVRTVRQLSDATGLREEARRKYGLAGLIGESAKMRSILKVTRQVSRSEAEAIFIRGESGTGKDLLARAIHYESPRTDRPFVTVMCTALQDTLLENDLFGHEKGAFTDAKGQKQGLFELADGGSIFLNEIGDMGPNLQAKLLRVLDEHTFRRVGGAEDVRVDVRVIAATNRDLEQSIREGRFRSDLFYRLNIFPLYLPPLRERMEDIPLFVAHFLKRNARKYRRSYSGISRKAMAKLQGYDWPGNVRELRNVLERACALGAGPEIGEEDLTFWRMGAAPESRPALPLPPGGVILDQVEKDLVLQALERSSGNQTLAAGLLGISRFRLRSRMKRYGILARGRRDDGGS